MKTIITGANGFIGKWLSNYLRDNKDEVLGLSRQNGDVSDKNILEKIIRQEKPDRIFHLAAQSNIPLSFKQPYDTLTINLLGTLNLIEIVKNINSKICFISVGSSSEYGSTSSGEKLSEESLLFPNSPYALSKMAQYHLIRMYRKAYSLNFVHVRPFAIIGEGKEGDAISDFAKGIVKIERGEKKVIEVGDLSNIRDFMDVRDAVRAMELISNYHKYDVYNICSGLGTQLKEILDMLIGMTRKPILISQPIHVRRSIDDKIIIGDTSRLQEIGFKTLYSLSDSLSSVLNYWRKNL
jgi:GDP-4-dehydro-6-deoxy-D-mannose reductase